MIRDLSSLAEREFDALVIGGGIYGLTVAYDAAQRGLSVALIERGDFGHATSFNHLKTIHGGLRYLQSADLARMRESANERRAFARIAPRFLRPLAFAMPTAVSPTRNRLALRAALAVDAFFGRYRNLGVDPRRQLPLGRIVAGSECNALFEGAIRTVLSAALWHDYQAVEAERLTIAFAASAAAHGGVLANYVEALKLASAPSGAGRVSARDALSGHTFDIRARVVVNAAGPWTGTLLGTSGGGAKWPLLKAMNVVTSRPAGTAALVSPSRSGRSLVLLPWKGRWVAGTSESDTLRDPDDQTARADEVEAFVEEVNSAFPALGLRSDEITLVHRGIVPAQQEKDGRLSLLGRSRVIDSSGHAGIAALICVVGVKYTTARAVAEQVVDLMLAKLRRSAVTCRTSDTVLSGAGFDDRDPDDLVAHAVRSEMAHSLIDVVVRRTGLGAAGHPGEPAATDVARRLQPLLGWTDADVARELASLRDFYKIT